MTPPSRIVRITHVDNNRNGVLDVSEHLEFHYEEGRPRSVLALDVFTNSCSQQSPIEMMSQIERQLPDLRTSRALNQFIRLKERQWQFYYNRCHEPLPPPQQEGVWNSLIHGLNSLIGN